MQYSKMLLLALPIVLSACVSLTPLQLENASDNQICAMVNDEQIYEPQSLEMLKAEWHSRGLDCSHAHQSCASMGLEKGTDKYVECRMQYRKLAAEKLQMDSLMGGLESMQENQHEHEVYQRWNY